MTWFSWLNSTVDIFGLPVKWSDLIGNVLALATVVLALRRWVVAWPVQIAGSLFLLAATLSAHLPGNAARQVVIIVAATWGWVRWNREKRSTGEITVRWATWRQRAVLLVAMLGGTLAFGALLKATDGSFFPEAPWHIVLADAWIFVGTLLAMYAQGQRIVEFWIVWLAVDLVGVPLAWSSGLYFSGLVYVVFFVLVVIGMRDWAVRSRHRITSPYEPATDVGPATGVGRATGVGPDETS